MGIGMMNNVLPGDDAIEAVFHVDKASRLNSTAFGSFDGKFSRECYLNFMFFSRL